MQANESEVGTWQRTPRGRPEATPAAPTVSGGSRMGQGPAPWSGLSLLPHAGGEFPWYRAFLTSHRACTVVHRKVRASWNGSLPSPESVQEAGEGGV